MPTSLYTDGRRADTGVRRALSDTTSRGTRCKTRACSTCRPGACVRAYGGK